MSDLNLSKVKISINNRFDVFEGRILLGDGGCVQDLAATRGWKHTVTESDTKIVEIGCNVIELHMKCKR